MIRIAVAVLFVLHGLIHLLGFAKAFGYADLPQLSQTVSQTVGVLWLTAALLCLAAAAALFFAPHWWWAVGALAVLTSQAVIVTSWSDAMVGTVANLLLLVAVLYGFASRGPLSLRASTSTTSRTPGRRRPSSTSPRPTSGRCRIRSSATSAGPRWSVGHGCTTSGPPGPAGYAAARRPSG
jgi:hypothetical protein